MPNTTSRLGLSEAIGADAVTSYRTSATSSMGILDNAALFESGTLVARSSVSPLVAGLIYYATDTGQWTVYTGSSWRGLDVTNFRSVSGSVTASVGDHLDAQPGTTITLPSPIDNGRLEITAWATVTSSNPVTVNAASDIIFGPGLVSASTFALGAPCAPVILQGGGGLWHMVAGKPETGFVPISVVTNYSLVNGGGVLSGAYGASANRVGDRVFLRGSIADTVGGHTNVNQIGTIPSGMRPGATVVYPAIAMAWNAGTLAGSITSGFLAIQPSGALSYGGTTGSNYAVPLDGVSYTLS